MKPIRLSLAGLQSYREKQEVDFAALCDAGVFGIFGPTGSGKSTILDAITLALYGKVERAPGGTQGIMNQAENTLSVSFTFALSGANGTETYRVDRQFKRGGDVSVNNTVSRLVKLESVGETVLADKAGDVNARVQEVLGLSMADFTRAVVLPQGKFAEFLALKGVERRQMLQRLFRLESYGDLLNARLGARYKEADAAVKQLEAEQLGLGDASEAALELARRRMNEAAAAVEEHRSRLLAAEQAAVEARRLREWIAEREETERGLAELKLREEPMERCKEALRKADQAARLRPILNEWENARQDLQEQAGRLDAAKREEAAAAVRYEAESAAYERDKQALEEQSGPLQLRIGQLQEALELEMEIAEGEKQEADLRTVLDGVARELAACTESLEREQALLDKAVKLQAELKEKLQSAEVKSEYRLAVQRALSDKQRVDALQSQLREMEREAAASRTAADKEQAALAALSARREGVLRSFEQLGAKTHALARRLQDDARDASGWLAAAEQELARLRDSYRHRDLRQAAVQLAALLADGEACPVCGSVHHPAPAQPTDDEAVGGDPQNGERIRLLLSEEAFALRQLAQTASGLTESLRAALGADADAAIAGAEAAAASHGEHLAPESAGAPFSCGRPDLQEIEAAASRLAAARQSAAAALARADRELKRLNGEWQDIARLYAETDARCQTLLSLAESHAAKRKEIARELERIVQAWETGHPEIPPERVEAAAERLAQTDREAEELRARLSRSEPYLAEQQRKIAALQERAQRLEREAVQAEAELKGREMLLAEKRRRLAAQLGCAAPAPLRRLLEQAKELWERLKRSEAESRQRREQALQSLQHAGNRLAAAEQAHASALAAWERAAANWREALPKAGFADEAEVRSAFLDEEQVRRMEAELAAYTERTMRLKLRLEQLHGLIGERSVTHDQWMEAEERLAAAKERQEELLQWAAKAERDAEELEAKHGRWLELERSREIQRQLRDRLGQLQSVLRGNAFVEYIAEEQLIQVSRAASERLGLLTRQRYALEVDSSGGFVIRDDANGGVRRPVSTLSGGETFLTSLALALALSAQIQLNGKFPLEFFFLDEGFGTLDPELLETLISALERLHMERLTVGVISHVPELKARLPRKLVVTPAEPSGKGSRIHHETM